MSKKAKEAPAEAQVVQATGKAGGSGLNSTDVQNAMAEAAAQAQAEGIVDPDEIRQRMLDARAALKAQVREAQAREAQAAE